MRGEHALLTPEDMEVIVSATDGYSGADLTEVCKEAAWSATRATLAIATGAGGGGLDSLRRAQFELIGRAHFLTAMATVKPSVSAAELKHYEAWGATYGTKPSEQSISMMKSLREARSAAERGAGAAGGGGPGGGGDVA